MLKVLLLVVLVWFALGILVALVKGVFWLLVIALVLTMIVAVVGRTVPRRNSGRSPW